MGLRKVYDTMGSFSFLRKTVHLEIVLTKNSDPSKATTMKFIRKAILCLLLPSMVVPLHAKVSLRHSVR